MCLSPDCFIFLPCPFVPVILPRETINENQIKVFSEHQTQKSQSVRGGSFLKVLSEIEVLYFLLSVGFFPSSICVRVSVKHLGRVIENTAGDGCPERDTAQFQSLLRKLIPVMRKMNFK